MVIVNRGFQGRRRQAGAGLIPRGRYLVDDFPVLSAGPTPSFDLDDWDFTVTDETGARVARWTWPEFRVLPVEEIAVDIHCITKWSKLETRWTGGSVDTLLAEVDTDAEYVIAFAEGDYTTNLRLADVVDGQSSVALGYDGAEHEDEPGFWESVGYHNYGDPWREQRYWGD